MFYLGVQRSNFKGKMLYFFQEKPVFVFLKGGQWRDFAGSSHPLGNDQGLSERHTSNSESSSSLLSNDLSARYIYP